VAPAKTDLLEECIVSIIRVTRIGELVVTLAVTSTNVVLSSPILVILMMEAISSFETSVLTRATWHHIPEDDILHSHRRGSLKSYIALTGWAL
jgi:hypothetical protein